MQQRTPIRIAITAFILSALLSGCAPGQTDPISLQAETATDRYSQTNPLSSQTGTATDWYSQTDPLSSQTGTATDWYSQTDPLSSQTDIAAVQDRPEDTLDLEIGISPPAATSETLSETTAAVPVPPSTISCPEWAAYLDGLNGAVVVFDPAEGSFHVYNGDLADARRSPCSTFKIVSSLVGLEEGAIDPPDSTRPWSGQVFWNDDWNQDMDLYTAFRTSCVWYYRQVIDDIGPDAMQAALRELRYGNCDLSDWSGNLNTNNHDPALTGFWIESSLKISPREQTQVLERIFGEASPYPPDTKALLEEVMLLPETSQDACRIYGKTGMGKKDGVVVDAWYTGFADVGRRIYFCVYLGETAGRDVSSVLAREIAVTLIREHF